MEITTACDRYLRYLAVERGVSTNTISAYKRDLRRYTEYMADAGVTKIEDVTASLIEALLVSTAEAKPPLSASSRARLLSTVRSAHKFWYDEQFAPTNPGVDVIAPKRPKRLPKALSVQEIQTILESVDGDDPVSIRDRAFLEFLYGTGARISEAVTLPLDAVTDTDMVRLLGKGNKERIVPLGSYAKSALEAYIVRVRPGLAAKGVPGGTLFLNRRGMPMSRQSGWNIVRRAAERAHITKPISPHTFRHSFATHLLNGGADIRIVQELLGHSSVTTTQMYTLVTKDSLREVYRTTHPRG